MRRRRGRAAAACARFWPPARPATQRAHRGQRQSQAGLLPSLPTGVGSGSGPDSPANFHPYWAYALSLTNRKVADGRAPRLRPRWRVAAAARRAVRARASVVLVRSARRAAAAPGADRAQPRPHHICTRSHATRHTSRGHNAQLDLCLRHRRHHDLHPLLDRLGDARSWWLRGRLVAVQEVEPTRRISSLRFARYAGSGESGAHVRVHRQGP